MVSTLRACRGGGAPSTRHGDRRRPRPRPRPGIAAAAATRRASGPELIAARKDNNAAPSPRPHLGRPVPRASFVGLICDWPSAAAAAAADRPESALMKHVSPVR